MAAWEVPDEEAAGVEIEPHVKAPHPYERITADQNPAWSRSRWYCPASQVRVLRNASGCRRGQPRGVRAVRGGSAMTVGPPAVPAGPGRAAPSGLSGYLLATVWGRTPSSSRFSNLRVLHHDRDVVR